MAELMKHDDPRRTGHRAWCELRVRPLRPHAGCTCGNTPEDEHIAEFDAVLEKRIYELEKRPHPGAKQ